MTTLPTDFIRLHGPVMDIDLNCQEHGLSWPPPDTLTHLGGQQLDIPFVMVTMSELTDEQATTNPTVARGAYYIPITEILEGDLQ